MEQEENKSSKFAVISIIFGVLGLLTALFYGGVFGIIGAVYGIFAILNKDRRKNMAIAGIVTSTLAILITVFVVHVGSALLQSGEYEDMENRILNELQSRIATPAPTELQEKN
ncbi:putative uncharacterized protein [Clostridium sp. CAG:411]|nr:DUF4190 domain-containing protein [Lachnospiraceae bacterium]CDE43588.1 putative uncharacterized protein [Clostridium sp. CAG:411]